MAEVLIEERLISGTGLLRVPPLESPTRYFSLLVDVIRLPSAIDKSFRYNPYRQRFATAVFLRSNYVIAEVAIDYEKRRFDYILDPTGQLLVSLKCAHAEVLSTLGVANAGENSVIAEHANLKMIWDEVRFVCYIDTALQVRLLADTYDQCGQTYAEKEPPVAPSALPKVPPGTPIGDISNPYTDDTVTSPYETDNFDPFPGLPTGNKCQLFNVSCVVRRKSIVNGAESNFSYNFYVRGIIEEYELVVGAPGAIRFKCQGANQNLGGSPPSCLPNVQWVQAASQTDNQFIEWVQRPVFTPA